MQEFLTEPAAAKMGRGGANGGLDTAQLGLWIALGSITMLFAAFTSAYIVRSASTDWVPLASPPVLWMNTVLLLLSSLTMAIGLREFRNLRPFAFRKWILFTSVLGLTFIAGQLLGWRQLEDSGVYLQSNPHSSFFYVLTSVHAVHLVGGIFVLGYIVIQATRYRLTPGESRAPGLVATYWHFLSGLWLYLLVVLFVI